MSRATVAAFCLLVLACAGSQATRGSSSMFATPAAEQARELAPDLVQRAEDAWSRAAAQKGRKDDAAAEDYRTEAELWLAAAVAEAERIELSRRLDDLQREEERWAKQLARDRDASATVAADISRYQARAVALREAERVAALSESSTTTDATLDAVLTRVRLNLALAEALGAPEEPLAALRARTSTLARRRPRSAKPAEDLLLDTEALLGRMRAEWPAPRPGASTELVEMAWLTGFAADRTAAGVVVRSGRFFTTGGKVSEATIKRFSGLLAAFPHGPVACQVAVPELQNRTWSRRVAQLVDRFARSDELTRVVTGVVETDALPPGVVQCTFAAYREP